MWTGFMQHSHIPAHSMPASAVWQGNSVRALSIFPVLMQCSAEMWSPRKCLDLLCHEVLV